MGGPVAGQICNEIWLTPIIIQAEHLVNSCPTLSRTEPWTAAKGRRRNKPTQQPSLQLENRFAPLLQDSGSPSDDLDNLSSSHSRVRTENKSESKRLQEKLTTEAHTLIVGDYTVNPITRRKCWHWTFLQTTEMLNIYVSTRVICIISTFLQM